MPIPPPPLAAALACLLICSPALAVDTPTPVLLKPPASFHGWEGLRVLAMEDYNPDFTVAVLPGKEGEAPRATIIALNPAKRRLDLFRWLPPQARHPKAKDADQPNALPAAPDFERVSVGFDTPPFAVVATDFSIKQAEAGGKNPGKPALFVLLPAPNRVQKLELGQDGQWKPTDSWDLLPGELGGHAQALVRYQDTLLVSMRAGIQVIEPKAGTRPTWLRAAQDTSRVAWQVVDLNGDGIPDLLEYTRQSNQALRLHQGTLDKVGQAGLLAPRVIREKQMEGLAVLDGTHQLFALEAAGEGPVQQLRLAPEAKSPVGKLTPLALTEAARNLAVGLQVDGKPTLAVADPAQPKISLFTLSDQGWQAARDFPVLPGIEALIAPAAKPGTLLFKVKDADGLFAAAWDGTRMTYPTALAGNGQGKVVGLGSVGTTAWWVLRHNDKLVLSVWSAGQKDPVETVFAGAFDKVDKVAFAGGQRLLVIDQYAAAPRLVENTEAGKPAKETLATHITTALMDEFFLLPTAKGEPRAARLTAGVVQFLGNDLNPVDQVMLPDNLAITGYAPDSHGSGGYALCAPAGRIFRLEADKDGGLPQARDSWRLAPGAKALQTDPALGLLLSTSTGLARLSEGSDLVLQAAAVLDTSKNTADHDTAIHRLLSADVDGDGCEELITCDDARHLLTVYGADLAPWVSWQVFTDQKYPYTGGSRGNSLPREPREAMGADLDGDGRQDLILACHDRLIIYLGHDPLKELAAGKAGAPATTSLATPKP